MVLFVFDLRSSGHFIGGFVNGSELLTKHTFWRRSKMEHNCLTDHPDKLD